MKTTTLFALLATSLFAAAPLILADPASATAAQDVLSLPISKLVSAVGEGKTCECTGSGRTATCTTDANGHCQCDYDWQGYPRCSA